MSKPIISVHNISKRYKLGTIGASTMRDEVEAFFARFKKPKSPATSHSLPATAPTGASEFWALRDVSFDVQPGEVLGIIGRNGAGKSTLLKILSRITEPTSGEIRVRGRIASLLEVGTGFHPELSGRENIFLNGAILGMTKAEIRAKFDEIVDFAGVEQFIDTPVKRYSSGMYVRLAFAVAAHLEPEILIVDEVLAVGDAEFQKKCLGKMKDVAGHGRTILFVSHNMTSIAALCGRGIYMKNGMVDRVGDIDSIIKRYMEESSVKEDSSITDLRLPNMGNELEFTSIEMVGMRSNPFYGETLAFDLHIHSHRDLEDLSIASSIFNRSGSCIGTLFCPSRFSIKAHQTKHLRLKIRNHKLAPDIYYMGFSIGNGGFDKQRHDFDIVIGRPHFEIQPHSENHTYITWQSTHWGQIHFEDNELEIVS
jgi:lipopolysaccharide transport system ATP-binding protein